MAEEPIILGQQFAAAQNAEAERIARGDIGVSPLGPHQRYDQWKGESDLHDPVRLPLDDRISALCRDYATRDSAARSDVRRSLSLEDFYTLLTFSERSAVFGLRTRNPQWLVIGLTAVSMIETERLDYRDVPGPARLLYAMFFQIDVDPDQSFAEVAALAEQDVSELLMTFRGRPPHHRTLQAWCYEVVNSPGGPGLIRRGADRYQPPAPLDTLILQMAELVRADKYCPDVEIGSELPEVWLSAVDDRDLASALDTVVAGAKLHAELRPGANSDYAGQRLFMFLVETANTGAAEMLHRLANRKSASRPDISMLAAQDRRLFCLLIARSCIAGQPNFETKETILRFLPRIKKLLNECPLGREPSRLQEALSCLRRLMGRLVRR